MHQSGILINTPQFWNFDITLPEIANLLSLICILTLMYTSNHHKLVNLTAMVPLVHNP